MDDVDELFKDETEEVTFDSLEGRLGFNRLNTVKVVDAPCGYGKSSWAIQYMKKNPDKNYLFVTPFLTEVERIIEECASIDFIEPSDKEYETKSSHLKSLIKGKRNIVCTHFLFAKMDAETALLFSCSDYVLILDEVMDVMHVESQTSFDMCTLKEKYIAVDESTQKVCLTEEGNEYLGLFGDVLKDAQQDRLYFYDNILIWKLPDILFRVFDEMYVLTYLFQGQIMRYYLDLHKIPYTQHSVKGSWEKGYELCPFEPRKSDYEFRLQAKANLNIYEGKLNSSIRKEPTLFWYKNQRRKSLNKLRLAKYNYFKNIVKGKSDDCLWTTFKKYQVKVEYKGYCKGFLSHNARATNDYRHKKHLAYLVDRHLNPEMIRYLKSHNIFVDEDLYALSELIQWVYRSAIRDGKKVDIFIPSDRMRGLLTDFLHPEKQLQNAV